MKPSASAYDGSTIAPGRSWCSTEPGSGETVFLRTHRRRAPGKCEYCGCDLIGQVYTRAWMPNYGTTIYCAPCQEIYDNLDTDACGPAMAATEEGLTRTWRGWETRGASEGMAEISREDVDECWRRLDCWSYYGVIEP